MGFIARWLVTLVAVLLASIALPFVRCTVEAAAVFSLVLGLLNAFVKPVVWLLTLPLTILTLGLFSLILNLLMFWLADRLVPGLSIGGGLLGLVAAALGVSVVSSVVSRVAKFG